MPALKYQQASSRCDTFTCSLSAMRNTRSILGRALPCSIWLKYCGVMPICYASIPCPSSCMIL